MQGLKEKFEFWKRRLKKRRSLLFLFGYSLVLSITLFSCQTPPNITQQQVALPQNTAQQVVRIVRPKQFIALEVLEKQSTLEKRLAPLGFKVQWSEFAAGPQELEALNAGGLDIAYTAESPLIFSCNKDSISCCTPLEIHIFHFPGACTFFVHF